MTILEGDQVWWSAMGQTESGLVAEDAPPEQDLVWVDTPTGLKLLIGRNSLTRIKRSLDADH